MKPFDAQTAFFVAGLLYIAMPLTVWSILRGRHDAVSVRRWTAGGLAFGSGLVLVGLRDAAAAWLSIGLANVLTFGSYALRWNVLRRELAWPSHGTASAALLTAFSLAFLVAFLGSDTDGPRVAVATAAHLVGASAIAATSWQLHRQRGSTSAAMLAGAYGFLCLAAAIRLGLVLSHDGEVHALGGDLGFALLFVAAIVSALYGNLGFLGIALEMAREQELQRTAQLAQEQAERREAERYGTQQAALLQERTELLAQRERVLTSLARQIQQPLNNASAAMQSAMIELARRGAHDEASQRLVRARSVMTRVLTSVDNILADAILLHERGAIATHDADVDAVIELAIADMDPAQQERIRIERLTSTRTASMDEGLIRLALRNLLANALLYSPPGSAVIVRISDSDLPLALLIDVCDEGPGVPAEIVNRLFGHRWRSSPQAGGAARGLQIVHRVMRLHGGEASLWRNGPEGATFRLTLPPVAGGPPQTSTSFALKT